MPRPWGLVVKKGSNTPLVISGAMPLPVCDAAIIA
jgi:hypothetical protein